MSYNIDELFIGQSAEFSKTVTEADVCLFAGVSGDFNPVHIDEEFAKNTFFKGRIAHGMLSVSFISTAIGTTLPGRGTIYLKQNLSFLKPVRIGDTVTAHIEVKELIKEKNRAVLHTYCTTQDGTIVIEGEATVIPPS